MTKRSSSLSLSGNHIPTLMYYQLVISHPYNDLSPWYDIDTIQYFWDNQHRGMNIRNYYLFWQKVHRFWLKPKLLLGIGRVNLSRLFFMRGCDDIATPNRMGSGEWTSSYTITWTSVYQIVVCEPLGAGVSIISQFYLFSLLSYSIILQYHTISLYYPYVMMVEPIPNGRTCIKL